MPFQALLEIVGNCFERAALAAAEEVPTPHEDAAVRAPVAFVGQGEVQQGGLAAYGAEVEDETLFALPDTSLQPLEAHPILGAPQHLLEF